MMESGSQMHSMVKVWRRGLMELLMRDNTKTVKNMEKASFPGQMEVASKEIFQQTKYKAKENTTGPTEENTSALGLIIKWMVKELSRGKMVDDIRDNTKITKNTDMDSSFGQTVAGTRGYGPMGNNMVKAYTRQHKA